MQAEVSSYTFYADQIARFNVNDTDYRTITNPETMNIMVPMNKNSILYFRNSRNNVKIIPTLKIVQTPYVETINIPSVTNTLSPEAKKSLIDDYVNILQHADPRKLLVVFCSDNFLQQLPDSRLYIDSSNNLVILNDYYSKDLLTPSGMDAMVIFKKSDINQKKTVILSRTPISNYQNATVLNDISNFLNVISSSFLLCLLLCVFLIILSIVSSINLASPRIKEIPTATE